MRSKEELRLFFKIYREYQKNFGKYRHEMLRGAYNRSNLFREEAITVFKQTVREMITGKEQL